MSKKMCADLGKAGVSRLAERLIADGFDARITRGSHPFDILVCRDGSPVAGIENKDFAKMGAYGTRIDRGAKTRKVKYAERHNIKGMFTTVTIRSTGAIGYRPGLANKALCSFKYDVEALECELRRL